MPVKSFNLEKEAMDQRDNNVVGKKRFDAGYILKEKTKVFLRKYMQV